jgi:hypothetical protein
MGGTSGVSWNSCSRLSSTLSRAEQLVRQAQSGNFQASTPFVFTVALRLDRAATMLDALVRQP